MIDCISMWQPWAQWVALRWKTVETRRHNRLACLARRGKRIAIHAANKWDPEWREKAELYLSPNQSMETQDAERRMLHIEQYGTWPTGALICTVQPTNYCLLDSSASDLALCDCRSMDLYGIFLSDVYCFDPIPWKGHQGIMKIPDEIILNKMEVL